MTESKTRPAGERGEAKEIKQGDGGVGKTSSGKPRQPIKGDVKDAAKVPGAVKGA